MLKCCMDGVILGSPVDSTSELLPTHATTGVKSGMFGMAAAKHQELEEQMAKPLWPTPGGVVR